MKTVLAPIDFSRVSRRVINAAVDLARLLKARVVLMHAVPPHSRAPKRSPSVAETARFTKVLDRAARRHLSRWQRELAEQRIAVATRCTTGVPVATILGAAGELRANYIVIGSHGRRASHRKILGGTSGGVLANTGCPVVLIPAVRRSPKKSWR